MQRLQWMALGVIAGALGLAGLCIVALSWDELDRRRRADAIEDAERPWLVGSTSGDRQRA